MSSLNVLKCKCILVGEPSIGKTCIAERLTSNTFNKNTISTLGCSSYQYKITVDGTAELTMDIWDTVGQERYASMNNQFFKGAQIAFLVYDITKRESFEKLEQRWIPAIKQKGGENLSKIYIYYY